MLTFTNIPNNLAPIGGELPYTIRNSSFNQVDIRIVNSSDNSLLGARRFPFTQTIRIDIAPALRRALRIEPSTGTTGLRPATGRSFGVTVQAFAGENAIRPVATAPQRIFLGCSSPVQAPALLTTMPLQRHIAPDACDELLLLFDRADTVIVTARNRDGTSEHRYPAATPGLQIFRLSAGDFPGAESLTVAAGRCGTVVYTVTRYPREAVRLAWRSSEGSVEHYTFPTVQRESLTATKRRGYSGKQHTAALLAYDRRLSLRSAREARPTLEALAELLAASAVWIAGQEGYTPVDVLSDEAAIRTPSDPGVLEIEIATGHNTPQSWN